MQIEWLSLDLLLFSDVFSVLVFYFFCVKVRFSCNDKRISSTPNSNMILISYCLGQKIDLPPEGDTLYCLNGSTKRIEWSYTGVALVIFRAWTFTSSDGRFYKELLANIDDNDKILIRTQKLYVNADVPATLILKNINITYNGTYRFILAPTGISDVSVYVVGKCLLLLLQSRTFLVYTTISRSS